MTKTRRHIEFYNDIPVIRAYIVVLCLTVYIAPSDCITQQMENTKINLTTVISMDDNGYFSGNVRVCDKDMRNTEERYKVAGFSGMWWSYNHLTPRPDATGFDQLQQASIQ
jgi:hypothetical protein